MTSLNPRELPRTSAIDVHTHLFPERLQAAVRRALTGSYDWAFPQSSELATFFEIAATHKTERCISLPYAHKPGMADALNAWLTETAEKHQMLIPFACIHPEDPLSVLDAARTRGSRGIKLHHQVQEVAPDDPKLFAIYEWLIEHDWPLMAHSGRGPTDNGLVGPDRVLPVLERYPTLRMCVPHMGAPDTDAFITLAKDHPNLRLDISGLDQFMPTWKQLASIQDQVLYGTDSPNVPWTYGLVAQKVRSWDLDEKTEAKLFRDNALRWLK